MSENIVSAEAEEQTRALARLMKDFNFGYFQHRYPKICQQFVDQVQFHINRTERTARLAWVEKRVMEVLTGEGA